MGEDLSRKNRSNKRRSIW